MGHSDSWFRFVIYGQKGLTSQWINGERNSIGRVARSVKSICWLFPALPVQMESRQLAMMVSPDERFLVLDKLTISGRLVSSFQNLCKLGNFFMRISNFWRGSSSSGNMVVTVFLAGFLGILWFAWFCSLAFLCF